MVVGVTSAVRLEVAKPKLLFQTRTSGPLGWGSAIQLRRRPRRTTIPDHHGRAGGEALADQHRSELDSRRETVRTHAPVGRVPVRLEKRSPHCSGPRDAQRMSVSSCLEEMLLHTNEGVGPHTKTTVHYIKELKKKHGIDYDSHASYRFVEQ